MVFFHGLTIYSYIPSFSQFFNWIFFSFFFSRFISFFFFPLVVCSTSSSLSSWLSSFFLFLYFLYHMLSLFFIFSPYSFFFTVFFFFFVISFHLCLSLVLSSFSTFRRKKPLTNNFVKNNKIMDIKNSVKMNCKNWKLN